MHNPMLYEKLQEKMNKAPVGFPRSARGEEREILQMLFDEEEAKIALHMPFISFTLDQLAEKTGKDPDYLEKVVGRMMEKGVILREKGGRKDTYRLYPVVVGFFETPFMKGEENGEKLRLASLWEEYWKSTWLHELGDRKTAIARVLPDTPNDNILPFENAVELVRDRDYHAVVHCACRVMSRLNGKGCRHSTRNCLLFGSQARHVVEMRWGKRISVEETVEILRKSHREGLVHLTENHRGKINALCNCCIDCCMFFRSLHEAHHPAAIVHSSYVARVDGPLCLACGICQLRCPGKAVSVKLDREPAKVNEDKCLGCGVCVSTCPAEAITLVEREKVNWPPDYREFVLRLLGDRGKGPESLL